VVRLFFALWPDQQVRTEIQSFASQLSLGTARLVASRNTHITLAFLGNVDEETTTAINRGANSVCMKSFSLTLDRLGWWKKPKIAWLAPTDYPPELPQLASELARLAKGCGVNLDERPYRPHLTLVRKLAQPLADCHVQPIFWNIKEFCLVESNSTEEGVKYQVKESWPLKIM
jgi:RNA 2',3'-cyclic 3'-phosphodiesterase